MLAGVLGHWDEKEEFMSLLLQDRIDPVFRRIRPHHGSGVLTPCSSRSAVSMVVVFTGVRDCCFGEAVGDDAPAPEPKLTRARTKEEMTCIVQHGE